LNQYLEISNVIDNDSGLKKWTKNTKLSFLFLMGPRQTKEKAIA